MDLLKAAAVGTPKIELHPSPEQKEEWSQQKKGPVAARREKRVTIGTHTPEGYSMSSPPPRIITLQIDFEAKLTDNGEVVFRAVKTAQMQKAPAGSKNLHDQLPGNVFIPTYELYVGRLVRFVTICKCNLYTCVMYAEFGSFQMSSQFYLDLV